MDKKIINDLKAILKIKVDGQQISVDIEGDVRNMVLNVMREEPEVRELLLEILTTFMEYHPEEFLDFLTKNPKKGFDFIKVKGCDKIPDEYKGLTLGAPKAEC